MKQETFQGDCIALHTGVLLLQQGVQKNSDGGSRGVSMASIETPLYIMQPPEVNINFVHTKLMFRQV